MKQLEKGVETHKASKGHPRQRVRVSGRRLAAILGVGVLLCVGFAGRAYNRNTRRTGPGKSRGVPVSPQVRPQSSGHFYSRLSLQPEADRMRRRLGERFLLPGRELTTLVGTLTIGAERQPVRIVRTQEEDGEQVTIALGSGPPSLTWNGKDGAQSGGRPAAGNERSLIERIALDSPDQFVLAQLRGAGYETVGRQIRPAEVGGADGYAGPLWDVVRVAGPESSSQNKPESEWRLYLINSSTGLIERIFSEEKGERIVAEVSGWANQGGERLPTMIKWTRDKQTIMELGITTVTQGPK